MSLVHFQPACPQQEGTHLETSDFPPAHRCTSATFSTFIFCLALKVPDTLTTSVETPKTARRYLSRNLTHTKFFISFREEGPHANSYIHMWNYICLMSHQTCPSCYLYTDGYLCHKLACTTSISTSLVHIIHMILWDTPVTFSWPLWL